MTFRHKFTYMVNSFVAVLDIAIMINILQEIVKILLNKMLKSKEIISIPQQYIREK